VYDAVQPNFRDVTFDRINTDENKDMAQQYQVTSIPRMVMLDASGQAFYNGRCPGDEEGLTALIRKYHN
jgi:thioredoxin-like negative regulator of GroEL